MRFDTSNHLFLIKSRKVNNIIKNKNNSKILFIINKIIGHILRQCNVLRPTNPLKTLNKIRREIILFNNTSKNFFVIQIGANDGISNDPIHDWILKFGWHGILIEPLAEPFQELEINYANNDKIKLINKAISQKNGKIEMYRHKESSISSL